MPKQICEISASFWFYYKEICYDARSHERKKGKIYSDFEFWTVSGRQGQANIKISLLRQITCLIGSVERVTSFQFLKMLHPFSLLNTYKWILQAVNTTLYSEQIKATFFVFKNSHLQAYWQEYRSLKVYPLFIVVLSSVDSSSFLAETCNLHFSWI